MCQSLRMNKASLQKRCGVKRARVIAEKWNKQTSFQIKKKAGIRKRAKLVHGNISKADVSKWILSEIYGAENELHRMFGAVGYAEAQLRESMKLNGCVLCRRKFRNYDEKEKCKATFQAKISTTLKFIQNSKANVQREKYTNQLQKLNDKTLETGSSKTPILQYKRGKVDSLRAQKADSLQRQCCALCERNIHPEDISKFLSMLDRKVFNMKSEGRL